MDQITQDKQRAEDEKRLAKMEMKEQMAELRRRAEEAEGDYEERQHNINDEARYLGTCIRPVLTSLKDVWKF
mgnify:CR=1 FL=1